MNLKPDKKSFLEEIGKAFIPKMFRPDLRAYLAKAGIGSIPYKFFGILFYVSIAITAILYLILQIWTLTSGPLLFLFVFLFWFITLLLVSSFITAGFYFYLNLTIYNRTKIIEEKLSEYLVYVSTNLKGGLAFDKSLWASIKPEFGILSEEMSLVSKKVMTGSDLIEALQEFGQKYDSPTLRRTIDIITGGLEAGGGISKILDQIIDNLRKTRMLKDEMVANTLLFTIFIGAIVIFISPLLFALAYNLLQILISVSSQISPVTQSAQSSVPFKFNVIKIDKDAFKGFSVLAIAVIATFSSIILSIIQKGDIRGGLKYVPFFVGSAILIYFFFLGIVGGFFSFLS